MQSETLISRSQNCAFRKGLQPLSNSVFILTCSLRLVLFSQLRAILLNCLFSFTYNKTTCCYVLLTVHLITAFVNNQPDAQFFLLHLFIPVLYMFRETMCSSSGESIVSIRPLVYVTLCRRPCGMQA